MKIVRKLVSILTIACTAWVVIGLIILLFGGKLIGGSDLFFSVMCFAIAGFFALNSINMINKNKVIGIVSAVLIVASAILIVLALWIEMESDLYFQLTVSLGMLSVLFNIIVSSGLDLGKNYFVFQIIVYVIVGLIDIITTLFIFEVVNIAPMILFYVAAILVAFFGVIMLKVLAKRQVSKVLEDNKDMVRITKAEYDILSEKAKKYDEIMANQKKDSIDTKSAE